VKAQVGADVLVADGQNQAALDKIVSQTRVILVQVPLLFMGMNCRCHLRTLQNPLRGYCRWDPWVKHYCDHYHDHRWNPDYSAVALIQSPQI